MKGNKTKAHVVRKEYRMEIGKAEKKKLQKVIFIIVGACV